MALAPHTSHWDFVIGVAAMFAVDFKAHSVGSSKFFRWPFRGIMRRLGAIPQQSVDSLVNEIRANKSFILAIFPEGTTDRTDRWKTGYYYAAKLSQVPILLVSLDYASRTFTFGPTLIPGDDMEADKIRIRNFYEGVRARHQEKFCLDE